MREAMRKNQEKLDAWKALLKDEAVEQQEVAPVEEKAGENLAEEEKSSIIENKNEEINGRSTEQTETLERDNDERREADSGRVANDATREVLGVGNGSDLRVFEEGLDTSYDAYSNDSQRNRRRAESERLVDIAKKNGLYIPIEDTKTLGEKNQKSTGESVVYVNKESGKVFKVKDPYAKAAMKAGVEAEDAAFEHLVHNLLFPETAYTFEGISDDLGDIRIVLSQKFINSFGKPTEEQIEKALAERGLQRETKYSFGNEYVSVTDVEGDNALLGEDGKVYFIDPIIRFKKPLREILSEYNNQSSQTPEEVVQQAAIDTTEKRKEDALASFAESGAYTEALGAATEDTVRKAEAFFKVIEEYGVRLTTKATSINGNYIQFVQGRIGKLSEEQQAEVMEAAVAYKRAYMDQLVIEKFNSELANITDSKVHEEQTNSANEAIRNVKAANDNMLNDMVVKGDFSNEHMLITSHKDTEKSDVHTLEKPLLKERNNAMDDYQKRYDEIVNLNKTEERAKKRAEKRADVREGDIKRKKVWIKNREGEIVEGWVKGDETFESSGAYTIFRNETGKERYTPRKRKDIFKDENGSDSYAPVVKQGESEIEKRTIRIKRDVKTSDVSKNIVDLIGKIKSGDVGSVSELKDIIKSLKSKIVTLCKKINESDFSDEVKVYLLDELDSAYFLSEQAETDGVQKSPTPTKGKVADAILKIRTTPQQRGGNRTYVDNKGNVKERKNETFETIEDLLGANNEVVEIISDKLNNVHEIIEESESSLIVETPLYSEGTISNSNPISLNEALKGIANLVRGFNLQDRIVVAMNLEQLKKINEKAYEAELNGEEVRGFYLPSKHQIVLYVPNLLSKGSVENVIFHEGIAHFGLRELLGEEEFNNFCKQVWKSMSYADKKAMMEYIGKEYVYNQKVSEGDMIAAAEEYVAHLAETPMFAEYLRNRNEQEAVSWIAKKWKKVCNLIRKIFKKRTGEELLSSDENIMDALYRSYQLLGSNDYAMFDYYRSLTEQMSKEDVKVGEINEEEIFSKGAEHRAMFSKVTPEMDADYLSAVERGDMETVKNLFEKASKQAGYTRKVYHSTDSDFTVFDTDTESDKRQEHVWNAEYESGTIFLSSEPNPYYGSKTMNLLINPLSVKTFKVRNAVKAMDDDGLAYEVFNYPIVEARQPKSESVPEISLYATLAANLVKSAEPITYDDNGNVIPLSERFNEEKEDIRFSRSKSVAEVNSRFNEELQKQIDGTLPKGHIYQLGMPSDILRSCGFPDMPIELSSTNLAEHARKTHHPFELKDVKDLVNALQEPIGVFAYGDKEKSQNVIVEIQKDGRNFLVGVHFNQNRRGLVVSDIRGIFPKDNAEWLNWINQGKSLYLDKEKIQDLIDKQRKTLAEVAYLDLDYVANIINNFENPSIESENSSSTQEQGTILFSKGKPAGYVNLSSEMFKGKRNVLSVLEAKDTAILNASKKWFESVLGEGRLVTDNHKSVYAQALKNYSSMKKSSLLRS